MLGLKVDQPIVTIAADKHVLELAANQHIISASAEQIDRHVRAARVDHVISIFAISDNAADIAEDSKPSSVHADFDFPILGCDEANRVVAIRPVDNKDFATR